MGESMSTPDPRTERAQLDKWLLQTNRYPGTVTAGEATQHLYDAAVKANDAITTEAARVRGETWREAEQYANECEAVNTERGSILAWHKMAAHCRMQAKNLPTNQPTWSTARPTVPGWYWYRKSGSTQALWVNDELAVFGINLQTDHVEEIIDGEWCPIARPSEEVG